MYHTIIDVENTTTLKENGELDMSPFNPKNKLVSVGFKARDTLINGKVLYCQDYVFFNHNDLPEINIQLSYDKIQDILDKTNLLVGHNIKHDIGWLLEVGFKYGGPLYDTMLGEYILCRGIKKELTLKGCCERYNLIEKKIDLIQEYLDKGIQFDKIPYRIVEEYGKQDVDCTYELFYTLTQEYIQGENIGLCPTLDMSNEYLWTIIDIERNGIKINKEILEEIDKKYEQEQIELGIKLQQVIRKYVGDTPINLNSPEQLSWLIYSRKVVNKPRWKEVFNIGYEQRGANLKPKRKPHYSKDEYIRLVRELTDPFLKTKVEQCNICKGIGYINSNKKDGTPFKKKPPCLQCKGEGILYIEQKEIAGFRLRPRSIEDVTAGGFTAGKETIEFLIFETKNEEIKQFLKDYMYHNALSTYRDTFIALIKRDTQQNNILHIPLSQCVTATGRLSSRFHNLPRNKTFPLNRVFQSRWEGGSLVKADYKGLEYRTYVCMAGDKAGQYDIEHGIDAHEFTAKHVETSRQDAKPHTFAPLYGAMPYGKPDKIARYYMAFMNKHKEIAVYQQELQDEAIRTKKIRLPSGREYAFPFARRTRYGGSTGATAIKNYPGQGFATADIVPCSGIRLRRAMIAANVKSLIINCVHDDYKFDIFPGEEELMINLIRGNMDAVKEELMTRYGYDFYVPLEVEIAIGLNLLELEEVK